jgi:hypothetical protein
MPVYGIRCTCGHEDEIFRSLAQFDDPLPEHCGAPMQRVLSAPRVMSDIEPYQAVASDIATGKPPHISSRSQHREFLKRNDFVELGNEMPKARSKPEPDRMEIGRTIKRVMDEKGIRA